jgi:hypothetical protein
MRIRGSAGVIYDRVTRLEADKGRNVQVPGKPKGFRRRYFFHDFKPESEIKAIALKPGRVTLTLAKRGILLVGDADAWYDAEGR